MRSAQRRDLLRSVRLIKETELLEAKANLDALGVSVLAAQSRFAHSVALVSELSTMAIPTGPVVGATVERLGAAGLDVMTTRGLGVVAGGSDRGPDP